MWERLINKLAKNDNSLEISIFDVKELYDAAYAEKAKARVNLKKFKNLIEKAENMDMAYRAQLAQVQATRYAEAA
ncbi:MAG: hypothetical protein AAF244_00975 [Pseudomonadota bacterium]